MVWPIYPSKLFSPKPHLRRPLKTTSTLAAGPSLGKMMEYTRDFLSGNAGRFVPAMLHSQCTVPCSRQGSA